MKRMLSLLLSAAMLCGVLMMPASAASVTSAGGMADDWAYNLVEGAVKRKIIPDCLKNVDLRENITRAQFAALAVELYEEMTNQVADLPKTNPFKDTEDPAVLKAYRLEIVSGISEDEFDPDGLITREQAATMLTNVYMAQVVDTKKAFLLVSMLYASGGDMVIDVGERRFNNTLTALYNRLEGRIDLRFVKRFADDDQVSDWAEESVYFMSKNGIIKGVGDNRFDPKANAQCQAAIVMAVQMMDKF